MSGPVIAVTGAFMAVNLLSPFLQPDSKAAKEGLESYSRGEYVEAVDRFRDSLDDEPDSRVRYNLGSAAYQGQNYPEAAEAYGAVLGDDALPPGNAAYDLGNVLFRSDKLNEALKAYRQALRENPDDADARYNYELTLRRLAGQDSTKNEDQEQQPQSGDNGQSQENPDQKQASPDSSAQSPPDQGQQDQQQQQQADSGSENQPQDREQAGKEGEAPQDAGKEARLLSPEEAQRLLNAVTPEERELIQARLKAGKRRKVEKDW